ncbi:hypothetical protein [Sphingopyxis flava]|uniref:Uncharacterized protein n=1 Tax=Sphingopyxis flava TaxID=1507287 RepID=A0A1T5AD60_9SPHN|nr:hypothetical protein [Sphingopyxis flava]SKB32613.1 hypothetical protein SAMN06295937_100394 [Sphingopyxis flava]
MTDAIPTALAHLDAAIAALSYEEAVRIDPRTGAESEIPAIECCIAQELERIERQLHPRGSRPTIIGAVGESITQAFIEIIAAHNALKGGDHG